MIASVVIIPVKNPIKVTQSPKSNSNKSSQIEDKELTQE